VRRLHFALFALLIGAGAAELRGAATASVSGVVRDSAGVPQMGAVVELLRPDLSIVASVITNNKGRFAFASVLPGRYAVKAMGSSFLPSLRENLRVQANTVVDLTLNTLYEVMQWLPAQRRSADAGKDDWAWTLRSAANRPLLRWLEDGPLVVVSDGRGSTPRLKARLMAIGRQGSFGEDGQRNSVEIQDTPSNSRELLASVDFDPGTDAGMESMLGFRQDLGFAGSVQSVAAVAIHPEIEGGGAGSLNEVSGRSWETINMGDMIQAEVGASQAFARFAHGSPGTLAAVLPFVDVDWRASETSTVSYRLATEVPGIESQNEAQAAAWLPSLTLHNSRLAVERGLHQELGWTRRTDNSKLSVLVYEDSLNDPVLEAMTRSGDGSAVAGALYDRESGLLRTSAEGYSGAGFVATLGRRLRNGSDIRLSYANGDSMVMPALPRTAMLSQVVASARPRHTEMYALALSGTLDGTGTRWRASYRWQPEDTVTRVAPFAADSDEPYLNIQIRQPVVSRREGAPGLDAMIDVRNLLAQGERPFLLTDGRLLMFAEDQRGITAGLALTF
jgi:hypothetical protein